MHVKTLVKTEVECLHSCDQHMKSMVNSSAIVWLLPQLHGGYHSNATTQHNLHVVKHKNALHLRLHNRDRMQIATDCLQFTLQRAAED